MQCYRLPAANNDDVLQAWILTPKCNCSRKLQRDQISDFSFQLMAFLSMRMITPEARRRWWWWWMVRLLVWGQILDLARVLLLLALFLRSASELAAVIFHNSHTWKNSMADWGSYPVQRAVLPKTLVILLSLVLPCLSVAMPIKTRLNLVYI